MPTLILFSKYDFYTNQLREQAGDFGWKTIRVDGNFYPDIQDDEIAVYSPPLLAYEIARHYKLKLQGPPSDWLPSLPVKFTKRAVRLSTVEKLLDLKEIQFVKPALSKTFPAGVYSKSELIEEVCRLDPGLEVLISEPVEFLLECRSFIADGEVVHISLYKRGEEIYSHDWDQKLTECELAGVSEFLEDLLAEIDLPDAVVIDAGCLPDKGWAVIEANEIWASGLYSCPAPKYLNAVKKACSKDVPAKWNSEAHYLKACPHLRPD